MHGEHNQFGTLSMKHISSTPFNHTTNCTDLQLPEVILQYIDNKYPSFHNVQEKTVLESSSQKFWETLVTNSIPTVQAYIDDVNSLFANLVHSMKENYSATRKESTTSKVIISCPRKEFAPPKIEDKSTFDTVTEDYANMGVLFSTNLPSLKELLKIEKISIPNTNEETNPMQELEEYIKTKPNKIYLPTSNEIAWRNENFSLSKFRFIASDLIYRGNNMYCLDDEPSTIAAGMNPNLIVPPKPLNKLHDYPSCCTKTDTIHADYPDEMTTFCQANQSAAASSVLVPNTNCHYLPRICNSKSPFIYSNSPHRSFQNQ
ncbi:uncharacterized protein [Triticum aestivum]|uniref:uncharacterized protein isoform X2 n=1 Tax=Triticum aestivum TaxID=4565 RepID=UPI001D013F34|nr:uncharacterized protein LOC123100008 isoform X2 [Triticum aestivum]